MCGWTIWYGEAKKTREGKVICKKCFNKDQTRLKDLKKD